MSCVCLQGLPCLHNVMLGLDLSAGFEFGVTALRTADFLLRCLVLVPLPLLDKLGHALFVSPLVKVSRGLRSHTFCVCLCVCVCVIAGKDH